MRPSVKKLLLFGSTAPYSGALLALDFVGSRTNGQPYYMLNGATYPLVNNIPGWTYTGGTPAGTGSYAARADGSLQFFPSYTNLQVYSQTFTTGWSYLNVTATDNQYVAPDGTTTGAKLTGASATGNFAVFSQTLAPAVGQVFTYSIHAKQVTTDQRYLQMTLSSAGYGSTQYANFDLSNGTVTATGSGAAASVEPAANGWYRLVYTATATATGASSMNFFFADGPSMARAGSITGTSANYIGLWGGQRELGSTASTYILTTTAAVTVATPRITDAGYWAEEARTNVALWSQDFSNAAWTKSGTIVTAAYSTDPAGTGTANRAVKSASSANSTIVEQIVAGAASQTHTFSVWAKSNTGSSQVFALKLTQQAVADNFSADLTATTTWQKFTFSRTFTAGGTGNAIVGAALASTGAAVDLQVWGAQFEANSSFATSPIPTTSVAVTRAADVGYVSGLVVPMSTVTMLTNSLIGPAMSNAGRIGNLSDGTNNMLATAFGGTNQGSAVAQGVSLAAISSAQTAGQIGRVAVKLEGTSLTASGIGEAATSVAGTYSGAATATRLYVGNTTAADRPSNTAIRRIVIYPRAFGNSELQAITTAGAY